MSRLDDIVANLKAAYEELVAYVESVPAATLDGGTADPDVPAAAAGVAAEAAPAAGTEPLHLVEAPAESGAQHGDTGETDTVAPAEQAPIAGLNTAQQDIVVAPPTEPSSTGPPGESEAGPTGSESTDESETEPDTVGL